MNENKNLIERLSKLLVYNHCIISFNYDSEDGYFCEVDQIYSIVKAPTVADLRMATKRQSLTDAIIAAIEYLEA